MKRKNGQLISRFKGMLGHRPRWVWLLAVAGVCAALAIACWTGLAGSGVQVAAYDDPALTPTPLPLPPEVQEALAHMGQGRANLPDAVADFSDLLSFVPAMPVAGTQTETDEAATARQLGTVVLLSGPTPCEGEMCYEIEVNCPQLAEGRNATLRVGEPSGAAQGTVLFASGWTGTYYWEGDTTTIPHGVIVALQAAGLRTVQIKWASNWWQGAPDQLEGHAKLACRPATVVRWVYDNLHNSPETPYCAEGHSNGASQVAYAIAQYGLADILYGVLFESGPNFARVDYGCIEETSDPAKQALFYEFGDRVVINQGLGLGQAGACVAQDEAFRPRFEEASVSFDPAWQYNYPNTKVAFVFGEEDLSTTAVHGASFHNTVVQAGSPQVSMQVVANVGHGVAWTPEGAAAIRDTLLSNCRLPGSVHELYLPIVVAQ